jgi:hypothetical protein
MRLSLKCFTAAAALLASFNSCAGNETDIHHAMENGLRYLESVQSQYGEFPTVILPELPEPRRSLYSAYDSNLFTTVLLADLIHDIHHARAFRIQKKIADYVQSQAANKEGLWGYFTTHNPRPLYPNTVYDLDDTIYASLVLKRQHIAFPDNRKAIIANKNTAGLYQTFFPNQIGHMINTVDCGVNANVLSYLQQNEPKICEYLNTQVASGKSCAFYYDILESYYLIGRAYQSGVSCLKPSIPYITKYALSQFNSDKYSVGDSPFKTSLAINILLAGGYKGEVLHKAQVYLLASQSTATGSWPADDFWIWTTGRMTNGKIDIIGKASSSALTTALVLKTLNTLEANTD